MKNILIWLCCIILASRSVLAFIFITYFVDYMHWLIDILQNFMRVPGLLFLLRGLIGINTSITRFIYEYAPLSVPVLFCYYFTLKGSFRWVFCAFPPEILPREIVAIKSYHLGFRMFKYTDVPCTVVVAFMVYKLIFYCILKFSSETWLFKYSLNLFMMKSENDYLK